MTVSHAAETSSLTTSTGGSKKPVSQWQKTSEMTDILKVIRTHSIEGHWSRNGLVTFVKVPLLWVMKGSYFGFGSPQQQVDMHARSKNTLIFL